MVVSRPNVVLLMADQLRWDAVGAYWPDSQAIVQTPHLDRIAREGARFERAYVANPFCMPARASTLTGRWPHAHGLWDNGVRFPPDTTTVASALAAHGYRTGIVGKGHLDVHNLPDSPDSTSGWDTPERARWTGPYYGFAEAHLTCGHNKAAGHYGAWLHREHPEAVPLLERAHALEAPIGGAWKSALPVELHSSTWVGDRSVDFIRRHAGQAPFFLWASFPDPHPPFCPPKPYADLYDPAAMPLPLRRRGETADKPAHFRGEADTWDTGYRPYGAGSHADEGRSDVEDQVRKASYYGMTTLVDVNVGRILQALEETGQLDDTVVVYLSDHGEMLGDHWLDGKGPWHYDGCARVPF
ncbi:MAG: sulfatase family protein, partial [Chloroflexota bacterium]